LGLLSAKTKTVTTKNITREVFKAKGLIDDQGNLKSTKLSSSQGVQRPKSGMQRSLTKS